MLREKVRKYYGNHEPVLSYVSQPPLNGGLILEAHTYTPDKGDHITYKHIGTFPYVVLVKWQRPFPVCRRFPWRCD